jgi:SulP family sulfate permease
MNLGSVNIYALLLSVGSIVIILISKRLHKAIPGPLIVIFLGVLGVYFFGLSTEGVKIIGEVPRGLPSFSIPDLTLGKIKLLLPTILTVTIMGIVESISIAKVIQAKHGDYDVNVNQELLALGISKIVGAFFQSIPSSGSFSRSAIASSTGGKTQIASLIAALFVCLSLIWLTPLFYYLPYAVLAGLILVSVFGLFDVKEGLHLWKTDRSDFVMMLATFGFTLVLGIEEGVLIGVVLSIATVLIKSSKPHIALLGRMPGTDDFRNVKRFSDAIEDDKLVIMRFDEQLYFANSGYFKDMVGCVLAQKKYEKLMYFLLDAGNIHQIDSTGMKTLLEVEKLLAKRNIELHLCNVKGPVRDKLYTNKQLTQLDRHHTNVAQAVDQLMGGKPLTDKKSTSMQSNYEK